MKVAGAAVELDLVEFFATGLALAAVFTFFGGMFAVYCANVRRVVECESKVVAWSQWIYLDVLGRVALLESWSLKLRGKCGGGREGAIGAQSHVTIALEMNRLADQDHFTSLHLFCDIVSPHLTHLSISTDQIRSSQ
jgi:hypothetical protein